VRHVSVSPKKHKQDIVNADVPDAVLNRKQHKKEKTFMREKKWQFKPNESNVEFPRNISPRWDT